MRLAISAATTLGSTAFLAGYAAAIPLTPGNVLIMTGRTATALPQRIGEYGLDGGFIQSWNIEYPGGPRPSFEDAKGIAVDTAHQIHVFNGAADPYASTLAPATGAWTHRAFDSNWEAANSFSGGIAVTSESIFASDAGSGNFTNLGGIIRFDKSTGDSIRFGQSNLFGFSQVSLGLDQLLYATRDDVRATDVVVFDPQTMAEVERLALGVGVVADATADADGNVYVVKSTSASINDGSILKFDREGNLLASLDLDTGLVRDIDLAADGVIVATSHDAGDVFVSDTSLQTFTTFRVFPGDRIFAAIIPVPEPSTASLLAVGVVGLAAVRGRRWRPRASSTSPRSGCAA